MTRAQRALAREQLAVLAFKKAELEASEVLAAKRKGPPLLVPRFRIKPVEVFDLRPAVFDFIYDPKYPKITTTAHGKACGGLGLVTLPDLRYGIVHLGSHKVVFTVRSRANAIEAMQRLLAACDFRFHDMTKLEKPVVRYLQGLIAGIQEWLESADKIT